MIRLFVTDTDGCLTDGTSLFPERWLRFHAHDGFGVGMLSAVGIETVFVSAAGSRRAVRVRAEQLVVGSFEAVTDKAALCGKLADVRGIGIAEVAYMGDDLNDVEAMLACGLAIAPANATEGAKAAAHYVTAKRGGEGAVREAVELILRHNAERSQ